MLSAQDNEHLCRIGPGTLMGDLVRQYWLPDIPSEPAESNFKAKVAAKAYATRERNGIVWAYMGPREVPPSLPDMEANLLNTDPERISILQRRCNWMQGLEGE